MMSRHGLDLARKWELDLGIVELLGRRTTALLSRNLLHLDDLDGGSSGSMPGAHVAVTLRDSSSGSQIAVFTVHVVGTGARVVSEPNAEVLDGSWPLLVDLLAKDDLADSLLDLLQTIQVVPEAGLGDNAVSRENAHPVKRRHSQLVGGDLSPDDTVLDQITLCLHFQIGFLSKMGLKIKKILSK